MFTASHGVVRKELARIRDKYYPEIKIAIIYPNLKLRDAWVKRLQKHYDKNPTRKNEDALGNAKDRLPENVKEMEADPPKYGFEIIEIDSTDYSLINKLPTQDHNVVFSLVLNKIQY